MLLIILFVVLAIAGICIAIIGDDHYIDAMVVGGAVLAAVLIILALIFGAIAISTQVNETLYYQNALNEKAMLEYRLEQNDDIAGNEMLYSQIVEFNNALRSNKKWANNLWTNWFNNQKIATIDYIVIDGMRGDNDAEY